MAIKNATDLLVYKKTSPAQPQITRIKVKSSTPLKDFTSGDEIKINNITDAAGDITDGRIDQFTANTGTHIVGSIRDQLISAANFDYTAGSIGTDGVWKYVDLTNGADGPVPTLEIEEVTAEFKKGAIEIIVIQSGQSVVYQPIAYSTSASISMNTDLRDITTKDSEGWQENVAGVRSFEMSTDALWDVNNAVGVESAVNDLVSGDSVDIKFSDRVRNLVDTEEVYGDGWTPSSVTLTKHLEDPFGQFTAAQVDVSSNGAYRFNRYNLPIQLAEGKKVTWSLYLKAFSATADSCQFRILLNSDSGSDTEADISIKKISGDGTVSSTNNTIKKVTGLSNTSWTRVQITTDSVVSGTDLRDVYLYLYPGDDYTTQTTADKVITASWQVETGTTASDYQNPTEVDCYQGKAFVNSVSIDAGTEENATYSASFTGTSELFVNGLGHELLADPYFDGAITTAPSGNGGTNYLINPYWRLYNDNSTSQGRLLHTGIVRWSWSNSSLVSLQTYDQPNNTTVPVMVVGNTYELTYNITISSSGGLVIEGQGTDFDLPVSVGSHTIRFKATRTYLTIKRLGTSGLIESDFISLKQVFS